MPAACAYPSSHLSHPAPDAHEADASDVADEQPTRKLPSSGALPRLDQRPTQDQCAPPVGSTSEAVAAPGPEQLPGPSAAEAHPGTEARLSEQSTDEEVCGVCAAVECSFLSPNPHPHPAPNPKPGPNPSPNPNEVWLVLAVERSVNDVESMGHWDALLKVCAVPGLRQDLTFTPPGLGLDAAQGGLQVTLPWLLTWHVLAFLHYPG